LQPLQHIIMGQLNKLSYIQQAGQTIRGRSKGTAKHGQGQLGYLAIPSLNLIHQCIPVQLGVPISRVDNTQGSVFSHHLQPLTLGICPHGTWVICQLGCHGCVHPGSNARLADGLLPVACLPFPCQTLHLCMHLLRPILTMPELAPGSTAYR
jgi:hypothetical protein